MHSCITNVRLFLSRRHYSDKCQHAVASSVCQGPSSMGWPRITRCLARRRIHLLWTCSWVVVVCRGRCPLRNVTFVIAPQLWLCLPIFQYCWIYWKLTSRLSRQAVLSGVDSSHALTSLLPDFIFAWIDMTRCLFWARSANNVPDSIDSVDSIAWWTRRLDGADIFHQSFVCDGMLLALVVSSYYEVQ